MKRTGKKRIVYIGVIGFITICVSCTLPTHTGEAQNRWQDEHHGSIEENAALFERKGGTYIFDTNDSTYIKSGGYTVWTRVKTDTTFGSFKVGTEKSAGQAAAGYGVVFSESEASDPIQSMLCVLINLEGKYAIGKIENGHYKNIEWWQDAYEEGSSNNKLQKGLNAENTIEIRYDSLGNRYELFLNNYKIQSFEDTRQQAVQTGRRGYVVVLSPNEMFPERNVRVEFREE